MRCVQHPSSTEVLRAPEGWDQGALPCDAVPITRVLIESPVREHPAVKTYWRMTDSEMVVLRNGGHVVLWVYGSSMPPVAVEVE